MFHVVKRDGEIADFQIGKITEALRKAFEATGFQYSQDMLDMMGLRVTADFQGKIAEEKISVEDIQDSVETRRWRRPISFTAASGKRSAT